MAAPVGNQYAAKSKKWQLAIERALANRSRSAGVEALDILAEKLLAACDEGDLQALKELGDRLDGKSAQSVALANEDDKPFVTKIVREIVRASDSNT